MTIRWETLPAADFADKAQWRLLEKNRYAALRVRLLLVCTVGKASRLGPIIEEHDVSPGDTITLRRKQGRVLTGTESISKAIRAASTSRLCDGLSSQVAAELSAKVPGFSGKIGSTLTAKSEREVVEELEKTLISTASHSIEESEGREQEIVLDGKGGRRTAQLRRRYWPKQWKVYVHSFDYLELSYRRSWIWRQVRRTMKRVDGHRLGWPLIALTFYEPQQDLVVSYETPAGELENPEAVEVASLSDPPPAASAPKDESLEAAARLAFPVTREEVRARQASTDAALHLSRGPRRRPGAKRAPAKASAKRKLAARKTAQPGGARSRQPRRGKARRGR